MWPNIGDESKRMSEQPLDDPLLTGRAALARGAWGDARVCFEAAFRNEETPESLEGLGMAAWGISDAAATFAARQQAYRLYRQRDDCRGAARMAAHLAIDYLYFRGEDAIARGWIQRGHRLLVGLEPGLELGWLAVSEAQIMGGSDHDYVTMGRLCAQAAELGKSLGDTGLEMLALANDGVSLVAQGKISEGMRQLDEATLAAVTGEMADIDATCTTCCCLIFACEMTRDFERAAQWVEQLRALAAQWSHPTMFTFCRVHYAGFLIWHGSWAEAEVALLASIAELDTQPAFAGEAILRLAGLRCLQGQFDAAEALFEQAASPPFRALTGDYYLLGQAAMAFAHNEVETAIDLAERFLRAITREGRLERVPGLELLFQALVMRGEFAQAEVILAELQDVAASVNTQPMQASARFAEGTLAAATANYHAAKRCFEDAVDLWTRSGAPFETAQARMGLAQSLVALGRNQAAEQQTSEALNVLNQLGALPVAAFAAALLHDIQAASHAQADGDGDGAVTGFVSDLTPRELEVLQLIAAGKSNQEIARELVLSIRTVERHISNIYVKIGASGAAARATTTAYALQHGLIQPSIPMR